MSVKTPLDPLFMEVPIYRLRRRKQRAYNRARKTQDKRDWDAFVTCQKEFRKDLNKAEQDFISNNLITAMKENTKQFWSYMKRLGNGEKGVADLLVNNTIISDGKGKAEALNHQFASVFTKESKANVPSMGPSNIGDIPKLIISEAGVLKQLQNLMPNKAPGPDQLPPWFLKMFAIKLAPMDTHRSFSVFN